MHGGDVLLVVLLLVFGCAAFFFGVICVFCHLFAWMGRGVAGIFRPHGSVGASARPGLGSRRRKCPNERCRRIEYRDAHYCSQCGTPLRRAPAGGSSRVR